MATDTNLQSLIINKMTKAQYQTITPDATQLYFITDDTGLTSSDIAAVLGFTPIEYKAGTNVTITNGTISAAGTTYTAGSNISITSGTISATTTSTVAANSTVPLTSGGAYSSLVSGVVVDSTANKIKVTKAGTTTTITINDVGHATAADSATSATTATKLGSSNVGNTITPIYLSAGTPTALSYTIAKSVPSDAVFTDTTYTFSTGLTEASGTVVVTDYDKLLQNTGSGTNALGIMGTATGNRGVGIGQAAEGTGAYSSGLGTAAKATADYAIQIGYGTNSTASTFSVGFNASSSSNRKNWELLDGTTGLIPDARLSTGIQRTLTAGSGITITNGTISATGTFPSQTGNAGKFLTTDGTVASWGTSDAFVIVDYTA